MKHIRKLDKDRMRQNNVRLIFEMIYRERGITRAKLATKTKMSAMNVGRIVDSLIERGLVAEREQTGERAPGRPGKKLVLCREKLLHLGVSLDLWGASVALVDPYGKKVASGHYPFDAKALTAEETLKEVGRIIREFMEAQGLVVNVVGVVIPGLVHPDEGFLRLSSQLGWRDLPVADMLRQYSGLPKVLLENDVKARARAENWCGVGKAYQNTVLMMIGSGIGAGIIIDGDIYRGKENMAGEIGHIAINTNTRLCECGQVGCLQAMVTEPAILHEARAVRPDIDMNGVSVAFVAGEAWAQQLMDTVCGTVLTTINLLANTFASEAIILCGNLLDNYPVFRQYISEAYEHRQTSFLNTNFDLCYSGFGPDGNVIGASTVALAETIKSLG